MVTKYPFQNVDYTEARARITNKFPNGALSIAYIWINDHEPSERTLNYNSENHFLQCWNPVGVFLNRRKWSGMAR